MGQVNTFKDWVIYRKPELTLAVIAILYGASGYIVESIL